MLAQVESEFFLNPATDADDDMSRSALFDNDDQRIVRDAVAAFL